MNRIFPDDKWIRLESQLMQNAKDVVNFRTTQQSCNSCAFSKFSRCDLIGIPFGGGCDGSAWDNFASSHVCDYWKSKKTREAPICSICGKAHHPDRMVWDKQMQFCFDCYSIKGEDDE